MTGKYILAIDQGTTASTALVIDAEGQVPKQWNVSRFLDVLGQPPHVLHRGVACDPKRPG